jgi:hypothetical protein
MGSLNSSHTWMILVYNKVLFFEICGIQPCENKFVSNYINIRVAYAKTVCPFSVPLYTSKLTCCVGVAHLLLMFSVMFSFVCLPSSHCVFYWRCLYIIVLHFHLFVKKAREKLPYLFLLLSYIINFISNFTVEM